MRLVVALIFVIAACGGPADGPAQTASAASAKWLEFNEHIVASATEASSIFAEWPDVTDDATDDAQAQKLQRWVDREKEWLSAHPSDSCYIGTYAPWSRGVNSYGEYARLIHEGIAEGDQTKLNQADTTHALAEMKKGLGTVPVSNAACMP